MDLRDTGGGQCLSHLHQGSPWALPLAVCPAVLQLAEAVAIFAALPQNGRGQKLQIGGGGLPSPQTRWMRRRPGLTCTCQCGPKISPTTSRRRSLRAPSAQRAAAWCTNKDLRHVTTWQAGWIIQRNVVARSHTDGTKGSRVWCGTPPILGVVNMVGTRNFTCYMGAL